VKASGKVHRLERYAVAQLPYHPQYLDAGMRYNAELKQPLDFGNQSPSPEAGRIAAPDAPLRLAACQEPIVPTENSIALKKRKRQQEGTKFVGPLGFRARMARSTGPRVKHRMAAKRRSTAVLNSNS
jgi:hypothetical protein